MTPEQINQYAKEIYAQNVGRGWWDDPDRCIFQTLQLVNTEVAEATEGDRKNLADDHLPHRSMPEVELADTLIRLLDLAGRYGWRYTVNCPPHPKLRTAPNLAAKHLWITSAVCHLASRCTIHEYEQCWYEYGVAVKTVLVVAEQEGYDLQGAVDEKLANNKTRADHDRENRAAFDGKKY